MVGGTTIPALSLRRRRLVRRDALTGSWMTSVVANPLLCLLVITTIRLSKPQLAGRFKRVHCIEILRRINWYRNSWPVVYPSWRDDESLARFFQFSRYNNGRRVLTAQSFWSLLVYRVKDAPARSIPQPWPSRSWWRRVLRVHCAALDVQLGRLVPDSLW